MIFLIFFISLVLKVQQSYPIVGGTASSHKYNLKDPRDLDAAFRLTFASGWTHSSTGMTPLNTFANTFFNPNSGFSTNDNVHLSYYSRTNSNGTEIEIGSTNSVAGPYLMLEIRTMKTAVEIIGTTIFVLVEIYVLGIIYWATKKQHLKNENNERSN